MIQEALGMVLVKDIARSDVNEDEAFKIRGLEDIETKVYGTLQRHVEAWQKGGAGQFVINVIKEGFRVNN